MYLGGRRISLACGRYGISGQVWPCTKNGNSTSDFLIEGCLPVGGLVSGDKL